MVAIVDKKIVRTIEQSDIYANLIIEELSKSPPNLDQVYEYIEMIGSEMADAVNYIYELFNREEMRDEYLNRIEKEHDRLKKKIVSFLEIYVKADINS